MKTKNRLQLIIMPALLLLCMASCKKQGTDYAVPEAEKNANQTSVNAIAPADFKVIGYLPSWAGEVSQVQFNKLTHVNYAFILPTASGGFQALENPSKLQNLVSTAHANNVKVLVSVGGWNNGDDSAFESFAASASGRTTFTNNVINLVNQYNLDGIDIDWEYPDAGNSGNNYSALMQQLSTAMHSRGKLLTAAVVSYDGPGVQNAVFGYVDFLNIMAYDEGGANHSTYDLAVKSLNYWKGRGLPASKANLGVPFYGRSSSEYVDYKTILSRGGSPNSDSFAGIGYNGIPTIKNKTNLAFDQAGGIMFWELSQDATAGNSLLSAIDQVVVIRKGNSGNNPIPIGSTVTLKGINSKYVSGEDGAVAMTCNRATASPVETFTVVDAGGGKIALRSKGKYVSSENGVQAITCSRATIGDWEKFDWITNADGTVSFRGNNGKYISSENGTQAMTCNRAAISGWEAFGINK
ncbi:GH18 family chitinase [Pedobacter cryoconitis]|uniref:glycosyl hydrolase family 18 protein n=1 Tax=Pedobacter cryoconitis TaxID=188932 RepID=UPI00180CFF9D|nr:glycosyl hydrolase family 18 protein [Pedobacter cryoconitis]MBB6271601.1 GH18 family chitinase [Pedobacter cryoconitis]